MDSLQSLPLTHSWPVFEQGHRFDLGFVHGCDTTLLAKPALLPLDEQALARLGIGLWECDLNGDHLTWSPEVYELFGLPRDARVTRAEAVALYCPDSCAQMERLRAYAIKHCRGFTLDAELRPRGGAHRWMRLMAAPIRVDGHVVRLHGLKQDVSHEYP
jgi:PAS domain-containing protein